MFLCRNPNHLYVWWTLEGPQAIRMRGMALDNFNDAFNLTMTFRQDSDVYRPYDTAPNLYNELLRDNMTQYLDDLVASKSQVAIWVVSNGYMAGAKRRLQLSEELIAAGLKIHRRGGLFPGAGAIPGRYSDEFHSIVKTYKFYLSFENQWHCKGYLTEKLWNNAIRSEAVPVVWGAAKADYEATLPPGSYIFADDYTPQELADYMNYLDKNDTAYREYFNWRAINSESLPNQHRETGLCQLCRILHGINIDNIFNPLYKQKYSSIPLFADDSTEVVPRIIHSLKDEFYGTDYPECY